MALQIEEISGGRFAETDLMVGQELTTVVGEQPAVPHAGGHVGAHVGVELVLLDPVGDLREVGLDFREGQRLAHWSKF